MAHRKAEERERERERERDGQKFVSQKSDFDVVFLATILFAKEEREKWTRK